MDGLISVTVNENYEPVVSGRALYEFLGVSTPYTQWFDRMTSYGFTENVDFTTLNELSQKSEGSRTVERELINHVIKLDMAKELAMIQRNEKGKQARLYFIQVEKDWNSPEKLMARALKVADSTIHTLRIEINQKEQVIKELQPKADYADRILQSKGTMNINAIAKDYGMSGAMMNRKLHELKVQYCQDKQWLLYAKYQGKGYTHSQTIDIELKNGTRDTRLHTRWTQKGRLFLYELLKAEGILPTIEQSYEMAQ